MENRTEKIISNRAKIQREGKYEGLRKSADKVRRPNIYVIMDPDGKIGKMEKQQISPK